MPGATNKFRYYADGSLQTASNAMGVIANSFDAVNRLTFTTGAIPKSAVSYGYYPAGQISNVTTIAGTTAYMLDAADRLLGLTNASGYYSFEYNANNGLISDMRYPNGVTLSNRFNVIDQATSLVWRASHRIHAQAQQAAIEPARVTVGVGEKVGDEVAASLTENQGRILQLLRATPHLSAREIAENIGISARKTEANIKKLRDQGFLKRIGPDRGGHWKVEQKGS